MSSTNITDYDIVFALHTGVTIMMQKQKAFDNCEEIDLPFTVDDTGDGAVHINLTDGQKVTIENIKPNMLTEIQARGFFMIYELDGDDMARCTPCHIVL